MFVPDLSSVAREAAEAEGLRRIPPQWMAFHGGSTADMMAVYRMHFIDGFTECASRIPSREDLASVLRRHNFDELLLGNIEWDGYTAVCACGWSSEEYKMPGEAHEAHSEHVAANLLLLLGEKISG